MCTFFDLVLVRYFKQLLKPPEAAAQYSKAAEELIEDMLMDAHDADLGDCMPSGAPMCDEDEEALELLHDLDVQNTILGSMQKMSEASEQAAASTDAPESTDAAEPAASEQAAASTDASDTISLVVPALPALSEDQAHHFKEAFELALVLSSSGTYACVVLELPRCSFRVGLFLSRDIYCLV